jgi:hypothetical protein
MTATFCFFNNGRGKAYSQKKPITKPAENYGKNTLVCIYNLNFVIQHINESHNQLERQHFSAMTLLPRNGEIHCASRVIEP